MGKFANIARRWLWLGAACGLTVLLAACSGDVPPGATPAPTPVPTPAATPLPRNPVAAILDKFQLACASGQEQLDTATARQPEQMPLAMDVREHVRRLQMVFQPPAGLVEGETEGTWEGPLFGAWAGEGTITGAFGDAAFSCTLEDGGRITGLLQGNAMEGVWEDYVEMDVPVYDEEEDTQTYEGTYVPHCVAALSLTQEGWFATVNWQGECSMLYITADTLYYAGDAEALPKRPGSAPEEWADWIFAQGTFTIMQHSVPEGEGTEDA